MVYAIFIKKCVVRIHRLFLIVVDPGNHSLIVAVHIYLQNRCLHTGELHHVAVEEA